MPLEVSLSPALARSKRLLLTELSTSVMSKVYCDTVLPGNACMLYCLVLLHRAYSFGSDQWLVEVDVVLGADTPLKLAHDVGEALQVI